MIAIFEKIEDSSGGKDLATSLWNLSINVGDSLGPSLGGIISSSLNFDNCCISISLLNLGFSFIFYFYFNNDTLKKKILDMQQRKESLITHDKVSSEKRINNHDLSDTKFYENDFISTSTKKKHTRTHSGFSKISSLSVNTNISRKILRKISDNTY